MVHGSAYKARHIYFSGLRDLENLRQHGVTLWPMQKGSGDCKNAGADDLHAICASLRQHVC